MRDADGTTSVVALGVRAKAPIRVHVLESDLLAVWDGTAIIVSPYAASASLLLVRWAVIRSISCIILFLFIVFIFILARSRHSGQRLKSRTVAHAIGIFAVGSACGLLADRSQPSKLLNNRKTTKYIYDHAKDLRFTCLSPAAVRRLGGKPSVVFIDARAARAFDESHFPGAINLPAARLSPGYTAPDEIDRIGSGSFVVVYGDPDGREGCELVARWLCSRGHRDVGIYTGVLKEALTEVRWENDHY